jgi:hypothetical protein
MASVQESGHPVRSITKAAKKAMAHRKNKQHLRQVLKDIKCCDICSVRFTQVQRSAGISVCFKAKCAYLNALRQCDAWRAQADNLRSQLEFEGGPIVPQQITATPPVSPLRPVAQTQCCPHPGCTAEMSVDVIGSMMRTPGSSVLHMSVNGGSVGRCSECRDGGQRLYHYCHRHYNKHKHHLVDDEQAEFYDSNTVISAQELVQPILQRSSGTPQVESVTSPWAITSPFVLNPQRELPDFDDLPDFDITDLELPMDFNDEVLAQDPFDPFDSVLFP